MNVLPIRPFYHLSKFQCPTYIIEQPGLEYVASVIRDDHEVSIFDCVGEYWNKYKPVAESSDLLHFGASAKDIRKGQDIWSRSRWDLFNLLHSGPCACLVASIVKEVDRNIITVIGGGHPSAYPENVLKENKDIDIVVYGEGEKTFKN